MKFSKILMVVLLLAVMSFTAFAEGSKETESASYPTKPIQVIIGYSPGGDADINARLMSKYVQNYIGQPLIVSNVTGAGGSIAAKQAKNAKPDGYTVFFSHWGTLMNELLGLTDFTIPEGFDIVGIPLLDKTGIFAGSATGKYKTAEELMAAAKANPGTIKFSVEPGTVVHLESAILQDKNDVEFHMVNAGGKANTIGGLKSNQIDCAIFQYAVIKDYLKSGDFIALGAIAPERSPNYPDVPTLKEQGIVGLDAFEQKFFFFGFPKGTPKDVISTFAAAMQKAAKDQDAINEFNKSFGEVTFLDSAKSIKLMNDVRSSFEPFIDVILAK